MSPDSGLWTVNSEKSSPLQGGTERLKPAAPGCFPVPGQWGRGNCPAGEALLTSVSRTQVPPLRIGCSGLFQSRSFTSLPAGLSGGFFSSVCCAHLAELLEVHLIVLWGSLITGSPWRFSLPDLPHWASRQLGNPSSGFPPQALVPVTLPTLGTAWLCAFTCPSLRSWDQCLLLWSPLCDGSEKTHVSLCSAFYLWLRWSGDVHSPSGRAGSWVCPFRVCLLCIFSSAGHM